MVLCREINDLAVKDLHERIWKLKASRKLEVRYMKFEELLRESKEEGRSEGRAEGQTRLLRLTGLMHGGILSNLSLRFSSACSIFIRFSAAGYPVASLIM